MNDKLLIKIIKIIKQSKQSIIKAFESNISKSAYVDFDTVLEDIQKQTKKLADSIEKEAKTFNRNYDSEDHMLRAVKNSFENINLEVKELIIIYNEIKSRVSSDNIQALLSLQVSRKVLYDYILWCEKLESAFLGIGEDEAIFIPSIAIESEIISFIAENTRSNDLNCWLPFFGGIGLGFLLDD